MDHGVKFIYLVLIVLCATLPPVWNERHGWLCECYSSRMIAFAWNQAACPTQKRWAWSLSTTLKARMGLEAKVLFLMSFLSFSLGWRPLLLHWRPSLIGWRPSLLGRRPLLRTKKQETWSNLVWCSLLLLEAYQTWSNNVCCSVGLHPPKPKASILRAMASDLIASCS